MIQRTISICAVITRLQGLYLELRLDQESWEWADRFFAAAWLALPVPRQLTALCLRAQG